MKNIFTKILLFVAIIVSTTTLTALPSQLILESDAGPDSFRYVLKVSSRSPAEMARYAGWLRQNGFDISGSNWRKGEIEVVTNDAGVQILNQNKLQGRKLAVKGPMAEGGSIDERFLNPNKVEQKLKALNAQFPQLTRLEKIGTSLQGRPIWALLVSTTPNLRSLEYYQKPTLLFDGMHHAREIMTPEVVMDAAESALMTLRRKDRLWSPILDRWNIWVVPMLNVDGNNIVWTQNSMWRKNARASRGLFRSTHGVDINRNYGFNWNKCDGSSGSKGAQDYRGTAASSEPETQALMNLAQMARPTASLSYHSYGELILYPFGCRGELTGENELIAKIAKELSNVLPGDNKSGNYTPGAPWQILYGVDGDSMSYMFGEFGALSYTFEINQDFQPSYDLKAPTVEKHRKAWAYFLNRMDKNLLSLQVVDGRSGKPVVARIGIMNIQHKLGEKPFQTNLAGNYFKVLDPGAYNIMVELQDGRKQQMQIQMNGSQSQVITVN